MSEVLLLRVAEAARLLACSRSQAYKLVQTGEIPAIRVGSSIRVPRAALERLVEARLADRDWR